MATVGEYLKIMEFVLESPKEVRTDEFLKGFLLRNSGVNEIILHEAGTGPSVKRKLGPRSGEALKEFIVWLKGQSEYFNKLHCPK
ncbi:MAG: hypothetical protein WCX27_02150 [Candidatus Paceibacterota bacterium]|jgi:hypothetical protein